MMRRPAVAVLLSAGLLSLAALSADLPEKWRVWRYWRSVETTQAGSAPAAEIRLPWEIYAHCLPGCTDVRIVTVQGDEVPFVLEPNRSTVAVESHEARVLENSYVEDKYTQVIADLGSNHGPYERVKVETDRGDFLVWTEVALSDDARTWRIVESRAPIARFRSRSVEGTQVIPLKGLASRYLRVRISNSADKFPVSGLTVSHDENKFVIIKQPVPVSFVAETSADPSESIWRTTLTSTNQPVSELQIRSDSPEFYRAVRISGSSDGLEWTYFGSGLVYRYAQNGNIRESQNIEFPEITGMRFLRVAIINGSDSPLANLQFTASAVPRTLAFRLADGQQYRLLYGNERASKPRYDLEHYFNFDSPDAAYSLMTLGPEEPTANFRDPRPFTERHPEVLWSALGIAIVLIGFTALRALRVPRRAERGI